MPLPLPRVSFFSRRRRRDEKRLHAPWQFAIFSAFSQPLLLTLPKSIGPEVSRSTISVHSHPVSPPFVAIFLRNVMMHDFFGYLTVSLICSGSNAGD